MDFLASLAARSRPCVVLWRFKKGRRRRTGTDLLLRMGINLGDIIIEADGDIYGEGVNVAARLEQFAEPGGLVFPAPFTTMSKARSSNFREPG